jgi:hypothetical protein
MHRIEHDELFGSQCYPSSSCASRATPHDTQSRSSPLPQRRRHPAPPKRFGDLPLSLLRARDAGRVEPFGPGDEPDIKDKLALRLAHDDRIARGSPAQVEKNRHAGELSGPGSTVKRL